MGYSSIPMESDIFLQDVKRELMEARNKFPSPNGVMCALTEEVGEVAKALMDEPMERVWKEAVQVAAMACRVAVEGDPTLNDIRQQRGANEIKTPPNPPDIDDPEDFHS